MICRCKVPVGAVRTARVGGPRSYRFKTAVIGHVAHGVLQLGRQIQLIQPSAAAAFIVLVFGKLCLSFFALRRNRIAPIVELLGLLMPVLIGERRLVVESGKDLNSPGYTALKQTMLPPGDTLVVESLDRLSRSKADIKAELEYFRRLGVRVKAIELPTTMKNLPEGQDWVFDMVNNILVEVLGTMAEKERAFTRQRQAEGYAAAKAAGKKMGRTGS